MCTHLNVLLRRDFLKPSYSLYAPITLDECHTWLHLNSQAVRNTEQVNIKKNILLIVGFEPSRRKETSLQNPVLTARPILDCYKWRN